jgi:hypothetical protein
MEVMQMEAIDQRDFECARKILRAAGNGRFEARCSKNVSAEFLASLKKKGYSTERRTDGMRVKWTKKNRD